MPVAPNHPHDIQAVTVVVVLVACLAVIYWRTTLRLIAIAVISITVYGLILLLHGLGHF